MTGLNSLRRLDADQYRLALLASRLAAAGMTAVLAEPEAARRYLRFTVEVGPDAFQAAIAIDNWLPGAMPALSGLAWSEADESIVAALFEAMPPTFDWLSGKARIRAQGLGEVGGRQLRIDTPQGAVYCRDLPDAVLPPLAGPDWVAAIPVRLDFVLGHQTLTASLLARIEPGDVVLFEHRPVLYANGRASFRLSIQQEQMILQDSVYPADLAITETQAPAGVEQIPLQAEFVLHTENLTVGEWSELAPGRVFMLSPDAERKVLLRVNGMPLARGELVDVEGRLGVEIHALLSGQ